MALDDATLAPILATLRQRLDHGEAAGELHRDSLDLLQGAGLLSLWRPRALGGSETPPRAYAEIAERIAGADSAAAWLMMGTACTSFDLRYASAAFVEEVFGDGEAIVCETFYKPMQADGDAGGVRVTGFTPFASGCRQADWIGHTALQDGQLLLLFHPHGALEILDDWDTLGMRGTASNSVRADGVFVPEHRIIRFGDAPARNRYYDGPLYRLPEAILTATFAAVTLGCLKAALDALTELAGRKQPFASSTVLAERPLAQLQFGQALASYEAGRALLHQTLDRVYRKALDGEALPLRERADLFAACTFCLQEGAAAVHKVSRAAGTSAIHKGNPLERLQRDTEVVARHAFGAEGRYATVAQAYWGLEVDFPLLAMD